MLIQVSAHDLHQQVKQSEEKPNDMVSATKSMATLMMQMSKFLR